MHDIGGDWTMITGATTDQGYDMAKLLAARGENLVLVCRDEANLCRIARELNEISDIIIMPVDLSKKNAFNLVSDECERLGIKVNALFNFA